MKEVKSIRIIFENCTASDKLSAGDMYKDNVKEIYLRNIQRNIASIACNSVAELLICDDMKIILNPSANTYFDEFGERSELTLFDRILHYNDIASIEVYFDDESVNEIYPCWNEENDYANSYQRAQIDENNCLKIEIRK